MSIATTPRATLDDLYREEGKAELIGGRIERSMVLFPAEPIQRHAGIQTALAG